jgi:hypothetical protein
MKRMGNQKRNTGAKNKERNGKSKQELPNTKPNIGILKLIHLLKQFLTTAH